MTQVQAQLFQNQMAMARENPTVRAVYANQNCNDCYGRGSIEIDKRAQLCHCVSKGIKKEVMRG
jgi:hypothetical protein